MSEILRGGTTTLLDLSSASTIHHEGLRVLKNKISRNKNGFLEYTILRARRAHEQIHSLMRRPVLQHPGENLRIARPPRRLPLQGA